MVKVIVIFKAGAVWQVTAEKSQADSFRTGFHNWMQHGKTAYSYYDKFPGDLSIDFREVAAVHVS